MKLNTTDLTSILKASESPVSGLIEINDISIDSRSLRNTKGTLYFAIEGAFHNGHDYIEELIRKEVTYFVVRTVPENVKGKATFFVVEDTLKSLQEFVAYYRTLFDIPVIGITGSNGKTIVKEWLNFLLHPFYNIIKSPKSYNSQVGVPLSVIGINEKHTLGIFEAGISLPEKWQYLKRSYSPP
ncbi:Mur ligase family protein [Myroides ceti]|uniref:Mur ligase family protein n=1 Tax=Paenimyroides ceti TaxID=395087 RepID=A0ABT8CX87_9FLAO|nr:Mur ligase family protein [Paenimyroides ceti]MDN3709158.1 Mur ligase family protein [Paenimyroides ceti]